MSKAKRPQRGLATTAPDPLDPALLRNPGGNSICKDAGSGLISHRTENRRALAVSNDAACLLEAIQHQQITIAEHGDPERASNR